MKEREILKTYIETMTSAVDLAIAAEHLDGVTQALGVLLEQGEILMAFQIDQTVESAPQYSP